MVMLRRRHSAGAVPRQGLRTQLRHHARWTGDWP
jgi:hypothetical protein